MFLPPAFPIFFFFSFCIHWQFTDQLSLVSVVYIPGWLELQNCKWAPCECSLSVAAEMAPVKWGAGAGLAVSMGTWLLHGPEGANKCLRSYFLAENIHVLRSEPTTVSVWATNKQLCACYIGKQNPERNSVRVKDIMGSNRKKVLISPAGFWADQPMEAGLECGCHSGC